MAVDKEEREEIRQEIASADAVRPEKFAVAIRVRGLVNQFGDAVVHDHLDLDVRSGEILGVVGGSGTGKSVLMRSIVGMQTPPAGGIEVDGSTPEPLTSAGETGALG